MSDIKLNHKDPLFIKYSQNIADIPDDDQSNHIERCLSPQNEEYQYLQYMLSDDSSYNHTVPEMLPFGYSRLFEVFNILGQAFYPNNWEDINFDVNLSFIKSINLLDKFVYPANEKILSDKEIENIKLFRKWEFLIALDQYSFENFVRYTSIAKTMLVLFESGKLKVRLINRSKAIDFIIPKKHWLILDYNFLIKKYFYQEDNKSKEFSGLLILKNNEINKAIELLNKNKLIVVNNQDRIDVKHKIYPTRQWGTALNNLIEEYFCSIYNSEGYVKQQMVWDKLKANSSKNLSKPFEYKIESNKEILWCPPSLGHSNLSNTQKRRTFNNFISKLQKTYFKITS